MAEQSKAGEILSGVLSGLLPVVGNVAGNLLGKLVGTGKTKVDQALNTLKIEPPPLVENPAWRAWYTKYGTAVKEARFGGPTAGIPSEPPRYLNTTLPQNGFAETGQTAAGAAVSGVTSGYNNLTAKYPVLAFAAPAATVLGVGWGIFQFVNKRW